MIILNKLISLKNELEQVENQITTLQSISRIPGWKVSSEWANQHSGLWIKYDRLEKQIKKLEQKISQSRVLKKLHLKRHINIFI